MPTTTPKQAQKSLQAVVTQSKKQPSKGVTEQVVSSETAKYLKKMRKTASYQAWFQDFQLNKDFYNKLFQRGNQ